MRHILYMWEPVISPHKLSLFRALKSHPRVDRIYYYSSRSLGEDRKKQGWSVEYSNDEGVFSDVSAKLAIQVVRDSPEGSIHVFSGMHWVDCLVAGIRECISTKRKYLIQAEPRVFEGALGKARLVHSWITEFHIRRTCLGILGIGRNAPFWFSISGFRKSIFFPHAYFLDPPRGGNFEKQDSRPRKPRVGYLGRLTKEKGICEFLSVAMMLRTKCEFRIAGSGELEARVKEFVETSGIEGQFVGVVPMDRVFEFLSDLDVLLVPSTSTNDGWAAVVSEALFVGTSVVATSNVGASICLSDLSRGVTVLEKSTSAICSAVEMLLSPESMSPKSREIRRSWALARLSSQSGADYIVRVLDHLVYGMARPFPFYA